MRLQTNRILTPVRRPLTVVIENRPEITCLGVLVNHAVPGGQLRLQLWNNQKFSENVADRGWKFQVDTSRPGVALDVGHFAAMELLIAGIKVAEPSSLTP